MKRHLIQIAAIVLCVINFASSEEYGCKGDKIFPVKDKDLIKLFNNTWRIQRCSSPRLCDDVACSDYSFKPQSDTEFENHATAFDESTGEAISFSGLGTVTGPGETYLQFAIEYITRKYYFLATDYENYYVIYTWLPDFNGNILRAVWLAGKTNEPLPFVRGAIEETLKKSNVEWDDLKQLNNQNCPPIEDRKK